jgi:hypothetical protein
MGGANGCGGWTHGDRAPLLYWVVWAVGTGGRPRGESGGTVRTEEAVAPVISGAPVAALNRERLKHNRICGHKASGS